MLKNLLIGILAIVAALAVSALTWDSLHESNEALAAKSKALIYPDKGERDFISSGMQLSGSQAGASKSTGFISIGGWDSVIASIDTKTPHYYEYGPAIIATGVKGPHYYEYGPAFRANGVKGPHYYEYGPANLATILAKP